MKNLIPHFIQEQYNADVLSGKLCGGTIFVDISGFTNMTESLMKGSNEGAEVLSKILNRIFNPTLDAIYAKNGFISTFAGDAFTAIFPEDQLKSPIDILLCAEEIQTFFQNLGAQKTAFGDFDLQVKLGVSFGEIHWGIVGDGQKAYFFRGNAISGCVNAENLADRGEILLDGNWIRETDGNGYEVEQIDDNYFRLKSVNSLLKGASKIKKIFAKDRIKTLDSEILRQFLPEAVLNFSSSGEFRNAVAIFISFDEPEHGNLNDVISVLIEENREFAGYLNKIDFGDKGAMALCVFGAPVAFEKNVERGLEFAVAFKHRLAANPACDAKRFRIGMAYGTVYAGIVGGEKRCEYTVLGDVVNLASRLTTRANFGEIWVCERIHRYASELYEFESLGEFDIKGKTEPINAYQLEGKKQRLIRAFTGEFIGREEETDRLNRALETLRCGEFPGVFYVYGEAGVGKTRFVADVKDQNPDLNWILLSCNGIIKNAFNPFNSFFKTFFSQSPDHSKDENKQNFEAVYGELIDSIKNSDVEKSTISETEKELNRLKTVIAGFLDIEYEDSLYSQLEGKLRYENTLAAFKEIFKALSLDKPLVIEIEDMQWIDNDSIKAIQNLYRNIQDFSILLIVTSRYNDDGSKPRFEIDAESHDVELTSFSESEISEFAQEILYGEISKPLLDNIMLKSDGNPLFIEQTLQYYKEEKIIIRNSLTLVWELAQKSSSLRTTITDLNEMMLARLDQLSNEMKEMVQIAAVLGKEFDVKLFRDVSQRKNFSKYLEIGENENIWYIDDSRCIFTHSFLRNVAYKMQLNERRRELHSRVAEAIEFLYGDSPLHYAELAFHYDNAALENKAFEYLEKAGDYAKENYQNQKAVDFYNQLLNKIQDIGDGDRYLPIILRVILRKAHIAEYTGDWDEGLTNAKNAVDIAQKLSIKTDLGEAYRILGINLYRKGELDDAMKWLEKALEIYTDLNSEKDIGRILGHMGLVYWRRLDYDSAMTYYKKQLKIARNIGNNVGIASASSNIGIIYLRRGDYDLALECFKKQRHIAEEIDEKRHAAAALGNIGLVYLHQQKMDLAMEYFQKNLELTEELGDKLGLSRAVGNTGLIYENTGKFDKALEYYERKLKISKELDEKREIVIALGNMAGIYSKKENYETALNYYDEAIEIARRLNNKYFLSYWLVAKAETLCYLNRFEEANVLNEEGLACAKELNVQSQIFNGKFLAEKIEFALGDKTAINRLEKFSQEIKEESQLASVFYELWKMTEAAEYREKALQLYKKFYEQTPNVRLKKKMEELTIES